MLVFPNAKINLGLNIINKRTDGYHELETCFYPVPWKDVLEAIPATEFSFNSSGTSIPGTDNNIVEKAYRLLSKDFQIDPVSIHLHKVIPIGAGLGGGSADAAFALKVFNDIFNLNLEEQKLMNYAVQLGADCAFFIRNKPMYATGIGEKLSDISVSLGGKYIAMVYPNIHISTQEAYSKIIPKSPETGIKTILTEKPMEEWKNLLTNDFEKPLFQSYPVLKEIKEELYQQGAIHAAMSGSGSCVFGIFDDLPEINFDPSYTFWSGKL